MILPLKRQDAAPTPTSSLSVPNVVNTILVDPVSTWSPFPTSFLHSVHVNTNIGTTTHSNTLAQYIPSPQLEDPENKAALAFKILVPVAGVVILIVLCYIWGPRGSEWRNRKQRHAVIAVQQQRLADARTAAYLASFPTRQPSGVDPDAPAVVRAESSASLPGYEREARHGEVVLGIGDAVLRDAHASELYRRTDSAVTLTAVPPYAFTTPSAAGSYRGPPTPTTPTRPAAPTTPTNATAPAAALAGSTATPPLTPIPPPTPSGPPAYRRTLSSTSIPRALSASSLTRLRTGAPTLPSGAGTPPGSPSTPTRARSGTPTAAYFPSLPSVPQAQPAPEAIPASAPVVILGAPPLSPRRGRRGRLSPLAPSPPGTFSLL